jgi:hypothetical protein
MMAGMKLQFGTKTAFWATAAIAIACAGILRTSRLVYFEGVPGGALKYCLEALGVTAPLWLPIVFLAFIFGRRSVSWLAVLLFGIGEFVAYRICAYIWTFY